MLSCVSADCRHTPDDVPGIVGGEGHFFIRIEINLVAGRFYGEFAVSIFSQIAYIAVAIGADADFVARFPLPVKCARLYSVDCRRKLGERHPVTVRILSIFLSATPGKRRKTQDGSDKWFHFSFHLFI